MLPNHPPPKKTFFLFLCLFVLFSLALASCKKEKSTSLQINNDELFSTAILKLKEVAGKYGPITKANITSLSENLSKNNLTVSARHVDGYTLAIGINERFSLFPKNSFLVLKITKTNEVALMIIMKYEGGASSQKPAEIFSNFIQKDSLNDGSYTIYNLKGNFQYQVDYNKNHILKLKVKTPKTEQTQNKTQAQECTNWYWKTTYYFDDGTTYETYDYIGRSCTYSCAPEEPCEPIFVIDEGGGGGGGAVVPLSKPKNWIVGSGGGNPAVWKVFSDDNLFYALTPGDPVNKGYFTSVVHAGSYVVNYAGNTPNVPFSSWTQQNTLQGIPTPTIATSYVKGILTFFDGTISPSIANTGVWASFNEF